MAFDFLGTLSLEQLRDLRAFLEEEIEFIDDQINALMVEVENTKTSRQEMITADNNLGGDSISAVYETQLPLVAKVPDQEDSETARLISKAKRPFIQSIKYKRERIEFKIKKMTDYTEQLREEIDRKLIAKEQTSQLLNEVESQFNISNSNHLFQTTEQLENYKQGIF